MKNSLKLTLLSVIISLLAACTPATPVQQPVAQQPAVEQPAAQPAQPAVADAQNTIQKINLNTSTGDEFRTIPNVGNRMVREFEEYRPYRSILQFRKEIGKYVDANQVAEYEKYVFVPIVPNDADADSLQQIPGVDAAIAEQLIAGRPYATKVDFITKLSTLISAEQLAIGEGYVEGQ